MFFPLSSATRVLAACQFINRYFAGYGLCCLCVILVAAYLIYIRSVCVFRSFDAQIKNTPILVRGVIAKNKVDYCRTSDSVFVADG